MLIVNKLIIIRDAGSAHQTQRALHLLPAPSSFPSVKQTPAGLALGAAALPHDFRTGHCSKVSEASEAQPGMRHPCARPQNPRGVSIARGLPGAGCCSKTGWARSPAFCQPPGGDAGRETALLPRARKRGACPHLKLGSWEARGWVRERSGCAILEGVSSGGAPRWGQEKRGGHVAWQQRARRSPRCSPRSLGALDAANKLNRQSAAGFSMERKIPRAALPIRPPSPTPAALQRRGKFLSVARQRGIWPRC